MNINSDISNVRPTVVAFVKCDDATTFGRMVNLIAHEERRLGNVLAALRDWGLILTASLEPVTPGYGFSDVADHLRASIGAPFADAALAAVERSVPSVDPAPAAVMPVWTFEPEGPNDDVLISSARLWGSDLFVEALRVEDDDVPVPVPSVRERFARWIAAAGIGPALKTTRLPGRGGSYVIFAAGAPA
jgi:hypothetical protein